VNFATIILCVSSQRVFIVVSICIHRLSPETFGYALVGHKIKVKLSLCFLSEHHP
jgi:hypothetical protein